MSVCCDRWLLVRFILMALPGALVIAIIAAPLCAGLGYPRVSALFYLAFAAVCHQSPQRSFALQGLPWAVCQRCAGIYLGLLSGALLRMQWPRCRVALRWRRAWVLVAMAPLWLDAGLPYLGLWTNSPASRSASGMIFGIMLMTLVRAGVMESRNAAGLRTSADSPSMQTEGGAS